jgi:hypothetical protein
MNPHCSESLSSQLRRTSVDLLLITIFESSTLPKYISNSRSYIKVSGSGNDCQATWMARCYTSRWLPWFLHPFFGDGGGGGSCNDWEITATVFLAVRSQ